MRTAFSQALPVTGIYSKKMISGVRTAKMQVPMETLFVTENAEKNYNL